MSFLYFFKEVIKKDKQTHRVKNKISMFWLILHKYQINFKIFKFAIKIFMNKHWN